MIARKTKGRIGSSFDDFLDEEGIRNDVEDAAIKEIIAGQMIRKKTRRERCIRKRS